jgi:hypothetical protein
MEAEISSEMLVLFYEIAEHHIPDGSNLHIHRRKNIKSYLLKNTAIVLSRNRFYVRAKLIK